MDKRLKEVTVAQAMNDDSRELVVAAVGDSLTHVFSLLQKYSCLVAPVYNSFEKKWMGFIDVVDILTTILADEDEHKAEEPNGANHEHEDDDEPRNMTAQDAINRSKRNPFRPILDTDSLLKAIQIMVTNSMVFLPVFNADGRLIGVLDSWQVLAYVCENLPAPTWDPKVIGFGNYDPVIAINSQMPAIQAFRYLVDRNVSAAAVIDEKDGKLLDNLSALDSRALYFKDSTWAILQDPVIEYLRRTAENVKTSVTEEQSRKELMETFMRQNCVYATPNARWSDLASAMVEQEIHRVYIAEKNDHVPLGFVSLLDMLKIFLS
eukprot:CAMPEP_0184697152 /NCGR_PEP_ID=MMETSP0313-20130426/4210_1 /TAXON_ID=2792 /ORGANISM="Porphyridium aerugineum, Strain SAG 1380-2" /LENGTH=320 /DNA_ID=CAMNT_0027155915 /DNA_START=190 /DNA_END=1152 /DNA_ORIENTATION=-